ncbi:MAG: hypothetical protein E6G70_06740 [Alphaproteobacteria bacterium]|nr:MAG: hypothetical protein E6G70_06740 [Alphaproteobacteria bacterium]
MRLGWIGAASEARSLAPLLRGEGWGEGLFPRTELLESPPHPALRADLSPQAGRGDTESAD